MSPIRGIIKKNAQEVLRKQNNPIVVSLAAFGVAGKKPLIW
jgi:hypothetical protein